MAQSTKVTNRLFGYFELHCFCALSHRYITETVCYSSKCLTLFTTEMISCVLLATEIIPLNNLLEQNRYY